LSKHLIVSLCLTAKKDGIQNHINGERVNNATIYLDIPVSELVNSVDTVMFCSTKDLALWLDPCYAAAAILYLNLNDLAHGNYFDVRRLQFLPQGFSQLDRTLGISMNHNTMGPAVHLLAIVGSDFAVFDHPQNPVCT